MKFLVLVSLLFIPVISFSQYSVFAGSGPIFPHPNDGVVSVASSVGYISKVETFNSIGSSGTISTFPTGLTGDFGDYVLVGQELYFIPTFWVDFDVVADAGTKLLKLESNNVSLLYDGPFSYENLVAEKSLGIGATTGNFIISEGDSIRLITEQGTLVRSASLPAEYDYTEAIDMRGMSLSAEFTVICSERFSNQNTTILSFDTLGQVVNSESLSANLLKTWTRNGQSFLFFEEGYMALGAGVLMPYPANLGVIELAYDAFEVAVVRNDEGQYYSFNADDGFVALGNQIGENSYSNIIKRPEGWYSLVAGILTFNPLRLDAPPVNPLEFTFTADSAVVRIDRPGSPDFTRTFYTVYYTIALTNTSDQEVTSASVEVLGVRGSYDPFDRLSAASFVSVGSIPAGGTVSTSGVHTYSLPGELPAPRAGLQACITGVSNIPIFGGEPTCKQAVTAQVSSINNAVAVDAGLIEVYPNPIDHQFKLETEKEIRTVQLFNTTGQLIQEFKGGLAQVYQLNEGTPSGFYTLQVYYKTGEIESVKVLIEK
jgi:hypothetical protein